jgi:hypothetical protein
MVMGYQIGTVVFFIGLISFLTRQALKIKKDK